MLACAAASADAMLFISKPHAVAKEKRRRRYGKHAQRAYQVAYQFPKFHWLFPFFWFNFTGAIAVFAVGPCRVDISAIPAASVRSRIVNLNAAVAVTFWAFNHFGNSLSLTHGLSCHLISCKVNLALAAKNLI